MEVQPAAELKRSLGLFPLTNIVIANMIGAGIFTTSGLLMADLGSPLVMLALWVVGGMIAFCGAISYGELGAAMPHAGGEYVFLSRLYHPGLGFLSGWTSFVVGFSAPIAASAIGFSEYLFRAFPHMFEWSSSNGMLDVEALKKLLAALVIVLFTVIHMRGIELGARIQNYLTILKVVLLVGFILAGLTMGAGNIDHFVDAKAFSFDFGGWKTIGLSLMWILFAYSGWNASTYLGSEVNNPSRILPRSLFLGTGIVVALYLFLNITFVYALSPDEMSGVISIGGLAMGNLFGRSMETVASVLISFALFSSLSAFIILGPRVYYAMARDGHFFQAIAHVHPTFNVPSRAVALQGSFALLMVVSGTFDQILTFMGFALGIFPLFAVFGVFRLRNQGSGNKVSPLASLAPVFYLCAGASILVLAYFERPLESTIALVTVLAGIPLFFYFNKRRNSRDGS